MKLVAKGPIKNTPTLVQIMRRSVSNICQYIDLYFGKGQVLNICNKSDHAFYMATFSLSNNFESKTR